MTTRLVLFDWTPGGHHALYVRRFVEAMREHFELVAAVPDEIAKDLTDLDVDLHTLGEARPDLDRSRPLPPQNKALAEAELDRLQQVAADLRPDQLLHLYADPIVRRLVQRPDLGVPTSLLVHFPRAHYRAAFGTALGAKEQARAWFQEALLLRWRRRRDAHALLTIDEAAARRWARGLHLPGVPSPGRLAPAYWVPEPPVPRPPEHVRSRPGPARSGAALYGSLAPRKGIDLLARAAALPPAPGAAKLKVTIAGVVEDGFAPELRASVERMRAGGTTVELRDWRRGEHEGLEVLASARCVVLPYPRYYEMSRVLLEACVVGTPVIVHDFGLLGHLVRTHGLGLAVDCGNPRALRAALDELTGTPDAVERYRGPLAAFAAQYAPDRFRAAALRPYADILPAQGTPPAAGGAPR
jgi:glycosyltransferase involved in cell wall biosynthesis